MFRLWIAVGAVLFVVIWNFLIKTMIVLVLVLAIVGGIWAWWEFRRKAMRKPPAR